MLRPFLGQLRVFLQQQLLHREFWFQALIEVILPVSVPLLVWLALIRDGGNVGEYSAAEMSQYYVIVLVIATLAHTIIHNDLSTFVREGTLSQWLIRPMPFGWVVAALILARLIMLIIPAVLIVGVVALVDFSAIQPLLLSENLLSMAIVLPLGIIVACCMNALIGFLSFWFIEIEGIYAGMILTLGFFSGMVLPVSLLPERMQSFGSMLPYHFVYTQTVQAISGHSSEVLINTVMGQLVWIFILAILLAIVWRRGMRRFDAVGG